ncbi:MAG: hypothetical protein ACOY4R_16900 [Pseudomonadota bacterium]
MTDDLTTLVDFFALAVLVPRTSGVPALAEFPIAKQDTKRASVTVHPNTMLRISRLTCCIFATSLHIRDRFSTQSEIHLSRIVALQRR